MLQSKETLKSDCLCNLMRPYLIFQFMTQCKCYSRLFNPVANYWILIGSAFWTANNQNSNYESTRADSVPSCACSACLTEGQNAKGMGLQRGAPRKNLLLPWTTELLQSEKDLPAAFCSVLVLWVSFPFSIHYSIYLLNISQSSVLGW